MRRPATSRSAVFASFWCDGPHLLSASPPYQRQYRLQKGLAAAHSVFALIDEPVEKDDGKQVIERTEGAIHFRGVSFLYPEAAEPALNHIDLNIEPGETVALVGLPVAARLRSPICFPASTTSTKERCYSMASIFAI